MLFNVDGICCMLGHIQALVSHNREGTAPLPNQRYSLTPTNGNVYFGTLSSQVISEEYTAVESYPVNCVAMYNYQVCTCY